MVPAADSYSHESDRASPRPPDPRQPGQPTVEVDVTLRSGAAGRAAVPSGASTGEFEATELRDGGAAWSGKGVTRAVANVNGELAAAAGALGDTDQQALDEALCRARRHAQQVAPGRQCDPRRLARLRPRTGRRGGSCRCGATWAAPDARVLPVPMMNVLNGGAHADNKVDFQEFMVVPLGAPTFAECLRMGTEVFHALKRTLHARGLSTAGGDEGGFAPDLGSNEEALQVLVEAIGEAGYEPGARSQSRSTRPRVSCTATAPTCWSTRGARSAPPSSPTTGPSLPGAIRSSRSRTAWPRRTGRAGGCSPSAWASDVQLVGDDLFVTNTERLQRGIEQGVANSILIKVNQIGTLTETLAAIAMARQAGYTAVMSHRSGETEDTTIADLAVATGCGQIKTGAPSRSDRVAKYNQLLRIEEASAQPPSSPAPRSFVAEAGLRPLGANAK